MKENLLGIDVGGTKCAIIYGIKENDELHIIDKKKFDTTTVDETIDRILCETEKMMNLHQLTPTNTKAIGICYAISGCSLPWHWWVLLFFASFTCLIS